MREVPNAIKKSNYSPRRPGFFTGCRTDTQNAQLGDEINALIA